MSEVAGVRSSTGEPAKGTGLLVNAAALVIIIAGLKAAAPMITVVLVAVFIAMVSAPAVIWLRRKRVPAGVAVLLVIFAVLGILSGVGIVFGTSVNAFVRELPAYTQRMNHQMSVVLHWLRSHGVDIRGLDLLKSLHPGSVMSVVGDVFTALGGLLGNSVVIILVVVFTLLEVPSLEMKFRTAFADAESTLDRIGMITTNVERYLGLKTLISLVTGIIAGAWVAILGVDFPLLWGLLAFLLNYIPTFGSIIAAIPPVLLALVILGLGKALLVALGYLLLNFLMGNIIEPRLMGQSMGLSTLVVLLSLLGWGWALGTAGMFLAVPLTMALKIVLESSESTRWLAILMDSGNGGAQKVAPE